MLESGAARIMSRVRQKDSLFALPGFLVLIDRYQAVSSAVIAKPALRITLGAIGCTRVDIANSAGRQCWRCKGANHTEDGQC
jgi:hypothetical protein